MGGGTAALLTYIMREQKMLSTATCVTFAPGFSYNLVFNYICLYLLKIQDLVLVPTYFLQLLV